jgi:hypothetical protein
LSTRTNSPPGQGGRVGLDEQRVPHAGAREDPGARHEHLARRVDADRAPECRRDSPQGVTDAGADVDDPLASMLGRERDDAIQVLAASVGRALDVRGRGAAELLLDGLDAAHFGLSSFANSTVFSR